MNEYTINKYLRKGQKVKIICECDHCRIHNEVTGKIFNIVKVEWESPIEFIHIEGYPKTYFRLDEIEIVK